MDDFQKLINRCKCGVYLSVNEFKDDYEDIQSHVQSMSDIALDFNVDEDIKDKMVELDTFVELTFYPDTPIGSYTVYHYSVEAAIAQAISALGMQ